jgi:ABC-type uncharacterized transport system auxiliary subunit
MKRLAAWTVILACMAAGCVKTHPLRYYTLSVPPAAAPPPAQPLPITLVVGRMNAPHLLRDDRVVYAMSDVELGVDEYHRWSEPPSGMIERLLVERLRASGQYKAVQHLSSTTRGDYILRGYLGALNEVDDPAGIKARFALQLELIDVKAGNVVWNERYNSDQPVPEKSVKAVVETLQKCVSTGLEQLTGSLAQYFAAHPPR